MLWVDLLLGFITVLTLALIMVVIVGAIYGVPFVPTPRHIVHAMIDLVPLQGSEIVVDLGAGDGRVLEGFKKRYPHIHAIGYEISPIVWLMGKLRAVVKRSEVQMRRSNLFHVDLHNVDLVIVYLFPEHVRRLQEKLVSELRPGSIVLTHTFGLSNMEPFAEKSVHRLGGSVMVRAYRVPALS